VSCLDIPVSYQVIDRRIAMHRPTNNPSPRLDALPGMGMGQAGKKRPKMGKVEKTAHAASMPGIAERLGGGRGTSGVRREVHLFCARQDARDGGGSLWLGCVVAGLSVGYAGSWS